MKKMKKGMGFVLTLSILCTTGATAFAAKPQTDEEPMTTAQDTATAFYDCAGHWAEQTINAWTKLGIISGYPDGSFRPDAMVTRAELSKILALAFDLDKEDKESYEDIDDSAWYAPYVKRVSSYIPVYALPVGYETNLPYVDGEGKKFLPECNSLRMHVAEALVEIKKEREHIEMALPEIGEIRDALYGIAEEPEYSNLYVMHQEVPKNVRRMFEYTWLAREMDIMQGDENGYFRPYGEVTRAELVTMIDRMLSGNTKEQ